MNEHVVARRMQEADFTKTFHDLMGGTKIGFDFHALRRSIGRYYEFMSMELLVDNISALFSKVTDLEDRLMDIPENSKFAILQEDNGLTVFGAFAMDPNSCNILIFVHSVYVIDERNKIFYEPQNKLLLKLCADGSVVENPEEFAPRWEDKKA